MREKKSKKMEIIMVAVDKLERDPNQPRTVFEDDEIDGLARSFLTEGIINPIEIDENYMIITGERRWRGAKRAHEIDNDSFRYVPCKLITIDTHSRFRRQVIENIHHNTMTRGDTVNAIVKLLPTPPGGAEGRDKDGKFLDRGISKLANQIGKSRQWVSDCVADYQEEDFVKEYYKSDKAKPSLIREARKAPKELQAQLKQMVVEGKIKHRDTINELIRAAVTNPEKTKQLMGEEYKEMPVTKNIYKIHQIAPPVKDEVEPALIGSKIIQKMEEMTAMLEGVKPTDLLPRDLDRMQTVIRDLNRRLEVFSKTCIRTTVGGRIEDAVIVPNLPVTV